MPIPNNYAAARQRAFEDYKNKANEAHQRYKDAKDKVTAKPDSTETNGNQVTVEKQEEGECVQLQQMTFDFQSMEEAPVKSEKNSKLNIWG